MMAPFDTLAKVWEILGQGTVITDAATRVVVYKDALKRTAATEAIFQAMEVLILGVVMLKFSISCTNNNAFESRIQGLTCIL